MEDWLKGNSKMNDKKDIFKDGFRMNPDDKGKEQKEESKPLNDKKEKKTIKTAGDDMKNESKKPDRGTDFLASLNKEKTESFQEERFIKQKKSYTNLIIQIVIIITAALIVYYFMNQKVEMIDFSYMNYEKALEWGQDNNILVSAKGEYSEDIETNSVILQNIPAGVKVSKDTSIILTVSEGVDPYKKISLPEFDSSWSRTAIARWLDENSIENFTIKEAVNEEVEGDFLISYRLIGTKGEDFNRSSEIEFLVSSITVTQTVTVQDFLNSNLTNVDIWAKNNGINYTYSFEQSTLYEEDKIISQSIQPDENMSIDDTIHFTVSSGDQTETVIMSNFINSTLLEVDTWAKTNKLNYSYSYVSSSLYERDRIISQSIPANDEISTGTRFSVKISKGESIYIPSFSSIDMEDAVEYFGDEDISVEVLTKFKKGTKESDFISQSIMSGTYVDEGTKLEVTYSLGGKIYVPSFINQYQSDFETWLELQNENGASLSYILKKDTESGLEKGKIISQSITFDDIGLDSYLEITVSAGIIIPDFSKISIDEARNYTANSGVTPVVIERYAEGTEKGEFISQSVKEGTIFLTNQRVIVYYSLGDEITVPDFTGQQMLNIEEWIDSINELGANLKLIVYKEYADNIDYGTIFSQNHNTEKVGVNENIEIIVSLGQSYTVIDLTHYTKREIEVIAHSNDLNIVFIEVIDSEESSGSIIGQEPDVGTVISKNEFIKIYIAE
jgi:beta-lactam-binding protein with PASTA domain